MVLPKFVKKVLATIGLMLIDIILFNDEIKGKLQTVIDDEKDYEKSKKLKEDADEAEKSLKSEANEIIVDASIEFYSIEKLISKKFDAETYLSYFNEKPIREYLQDVAAVDDYIYFLLNKKKTEIKDYIEKLKNIKVRCEEYLEKEKNAGNSKDEKFIDLDEKLKKLKKSYKLLRLAVESESLINPEIDFRKYFPVEPVKSKSDKDNSDEKEETPPANNETVNVPI